MTGKCKVNQRLTAVGKLRNIFTSLTPLTQHIVNRPQIFQVVHDTTEVSRNITNFPGDTKSLMNTPEHTIFLKLKSV